MKTATETKVVTWMSPTGDTMDICRECEAKLEGRWPKDARGQEYCQVSRGLHRGECQCEDHQ